MSNTPSAHFGAGDSEAATCQVDSPLLPALLSAWPSEVAPGHSPSHTADQGRARQPARMRLLATSFLKPCGVLPDGHDFAARRGAPNLACRCSSALHVNVNVQPPTTFAEADIVSVSMQTMLALERAARIDTLCADEPLVSDLGESALEIRFRVALAPSSVCLQMLTSEFRYLTRRLPQPAPLACWAFWPLKTQPRNAVLFWRSGSRWPIPARYQMLCCLGECS